MNDDERTSADGQAPTRDWGSDLDILDPRFVMDPAAVWRELRDSCPVAFTERRGRTWMPVRYDDIADIANDTTPFSSRRVGVIDLPDSRGGDRPPLTAPPITSDPPDHTWARRILLPAFSPHQIDVMTPITRGVARGLVQEFADRGHADAARDYAQHIPVRVFRVQLRLLRLRRYIQTCHTKMHLDPARPNRACAGCPVQCA